ncbi:hypothetical protein [Halorubrum sp. BV1]|uniref:hypothetical protein n=1 Tax=Halorubrum sp. BV1 TaxID=1498500 RepID=UPI00067932C1|nr:hypothetical protein [Halorubrum sp. BV1]
MAIFEDRPICERCGNRILYPNRHEATCNPEPTFDGVCPMCGEDYEDAGYMEHLSECPADR